MNGGGATPQNCFVDHKWQLKAESNQFTTSQLQHEDHFGTKN